MISPRYIPALCVLVLFALAPTWMHSYSGALEVDGLTSAAIPSVLGRYHGTATSRRATWGKRRFDSDDWIERTYADGAHEVRLTVVRSYDPKTLYHHPELAVAYGPSFVAATIEQLPGRPEIPVHVLRPAPGADTVGLYVLRYEDRFVEDPISFQIRTAGELLFTRRRPMTLFFTTESNVPRDGTLDRLGSSAVLVAAIDAFIAQEPHVTATTQLDCCP